MYIDGGAQATGQDRFSQPWVRVVVGPSKSRTVSSHAVFYFPAVTDISERHWEVKFGSFKDFGCSFI